MSSLSARGGQQRELVTAALLGLGGGLRSFAPPAVLAARGKGPFPGPARFIAYGAAIGEIIADKQPDMRTRFARRGLTMRIAFSAYAGQELDGPAAAAVAALAAVMSAWGGSQLRSVTTGTRRAFAEDVTSYTLVAWATRRQRRR